ncbi:MAG: PilW family protein [Desulfuromonadales bacterium]|nr:PilW family protein [Desulfuromonadales bacterium]
MKKNSDSGFTLIEVLIAMVISLVIISGAYSLFNSQQQQTIVQTNVSDAQQTLRAAMGYMSRDVRMAGYDPKGTSNFGITDIKFHDFTASTAADGSSYISFAWDQNENGVVDTGESLNYRLSNTSTVAPNSIALMYGTPAREPLAGFITTLGLAYANDTDEDGKLDRTAGGDIIWSVDTDNDDDWDQLNLTTGATVETDTNVDTRTIRAVRIWMLSQSQAPDAKYTDTKTYIVGPHVVTPNNNFRHRLLERTILCRNMGL